MNLARLSLCATLPFLVGFLSGCLIRNQETQNGSAPVQDLPPGRESPASRSIEVKVNRNIELFGLLMQLDLAPDALNNNDVVEIAGRKARWRDWYAPAVRNYERYKAFEKSSMMQMYREYMARGFYNDFFIGFLLQVDEVPHAAIAADTDPGVIRSFSKGRDMDEAQNKASEFLQALNRFYEEIDFQRYLTDHREHYRIMQREVTRNLPAGRVIATMEQFYRQKFKRYCLVPSLNIPNGMGFGKLHATARTIYNTFGPFGFESLEGNQPELGFDNAAKVQSLSIHEFGHSFVNPAIDKVPKELIKETEALFAPIKEQMKRQSYPSWTTCLYEHFVRAGEVIIARKLGDSARADEIMKDNLGKGFIYLPAIVSELERFDREAGEFGSYEQFVPQVIRNCHQRKADSR